MYHLAARLGITDFVVSGNKTARIHAIRAILESEHIDPVLYSPRFVAQGGSISDAAKVAGKSWHAIVGRGIYEAADIRQAAMEMANGL